MPVDDESLMRRALQLAERGRGAVEPNPLVGAVLTRDGAIVGEGWHERFGAAHAEVNALAAAGADARGTTLHVTLEPCCHQGKTPACTDAIIAAGVARVVAAAADPFPQVAGQGLQQLRTAGVNVSVGVLEAEAREQNAAYWKLLTYGRPYVIAKWAMSLDGKIATRSGDSRWISGDASRARVHQLRGRVDAILVGIVTALADDPLLTARPPGPRVAARIVLDSQLRLPRNSQLVRTVREAPVLVVHSPKASAERRMELEVAGCECLALDAPQDRPSLAALLDELGRRRCTNLLVEGGSSILGALLDARLVDEVQAYVAPMLIGGQKAPGPVGGLGSGRLADAMRLASWTVEAIGNDWLVRGRLQP